MSDTVSVEFSTGPAGACDHIRGYSAPVEGLIYTSDSLEVAFDFCPLCGVSLTEGDDSPETKTVHIPRRWLYACLIALLLVFVAGLGVGELFGIAPVELKFTAVSPTPRPSPSSFLTQKAR